MPKPWAFSIPVMRIVTPLEAVLNQAQNARQHAEKKTRGLLPKLSPLSVPLIRIAKPLSELLPNRRAVPGPPTISLAFLRAQRDECDDRPEQRLGETNMSTFTIDASNTITAYTSAPEASQGGAGRSPFDSQNKLAEVTAPWPLTRLVEIWNNIPGSNQVKKFQDRKTAVARIWRALQTLAANSPANQREGCKESANAEAPAQSRKAGRKKKTSTKSTSQAKLIDQTTSGRTNKKAEVIALLQRAKGVTLAEVVQSTGWQKHTVRGFVSILGSQGGYRIESSKNAAGERTYRIPK